MSEGDGRSGDVGSDGHGGGGEVVDEAERAFRGVGDEVEGGGLENGVFGAGLSKAVLNVEVGVFRG